MNGSIKSSAKREIKKRNSNHFLLFHIQINGEFNQDFSGKASTIQDELS